MRLASHTRGVQMTLTVPSAGGSMGMDMGTGVVEAMDMAAVTAMAAKDTAPRKVICGTRTSDWLLTQGS